MDKQIPWNSILDSIQNNAEKEGTLLGDWLRESKGNQQIYDELNVIYKINGTIPDCYVPDPDKGWGNILRRISRSGQKIRLNKYLFRAAASILLCAFGAALFWAVDRHTEVGGVFSEVVSPYGHKTMVMLPDSSVVWLNGDSKLRYKTDFSKERRVELKGEALFEVHKNPGKVFSVQSNTIRVEVFGTKFNFRSYENDEEVEVALLEGSVGIYKGNKFLKEMSPGEVATYLPQRNKLQYSRNDDLGQITSWQSDELVIDNMTAREIFKYLERWYGVQIGYDGRLNLEQKLSFKVKTESLSELLSIMEKIYPIKYTINGKKVTVTKP